MMSCMNCQLHAAGWQFQSTPQDVDHMPWKPRLRGLKSLETRHLAGFLGVSKPCGSTLSSVCRMRLYDSIPRGRRVQKVSLKWLVGGSYDIQVGIDIELCDLSLAALLQPCRAHGMGQTARFHELKPKYCLFLDVGTLEHPRTIMFF